MSLVTDLAGRCRFPPAGSEVSAAVSGGADSLALLVLATGAGCRVTAVHVDHGLRAGSAAEADVVAAAARRFGAGFRAERVEVAPGPNLEARARAARLSVLPPGVLTGHTLDDQAETVLLGLSRGAGARALAGMAGVRGRYRRPLLQLDRAATRQACREAGLQPWHDPYNDDPAYARVRVRGEVMPVLEAALGPGVAAALARSAGQLREDADALDALTPDLPVEPRCTELAALLPAIRARALKRWAEAATGLALTSAHVDALRALVERWRGQGPVALPGGGRVSRVEGRLTFAGDLG